MANRDGISRQPWRRLVLLTMGAISGATLLLLGAPMPGPRSPLMLRSLAVTPATTSNEDTAWDHILKPMARKKRTLGSRGGICPLFPTTKATPLVVWSQSPLLVWSGTIRRVEVHALNQPNALWRATIAPASDASPYHSVQYAGPALQPGQSYEWQLFDQFAGQSTTPTLTLRFRTMTANDRNRLTAALTTLETQLKANAANAETIAQQRAKFFGDRQLWADALQAALTVKPSAPALKRAMQTLAEQYCQTSEQ